MKKKNGTRNQPPTSPSPAEIQDYAFHLFEQSGRIPGRDLENWLEAEACLKANIPRHHSRTRLHRHLARLGLGPIEQEELCVIPLEARHLSS